MTNFYENKDLIPRSTWIPNYIERKLKDKWILTNRMGDWTILDDTEFNNLNSVYTSKKQITKLSERNLVITENNQSTLLSRWQKWNGSNFSGPSLHIIHLTLRCNLGCNYCHSSAIPVTATGKDLTDENAIKIVEFITETPSDIISVAFQGGEPTLLPKTIDKIMKLLIASCNDKGKKLYAGITTNGTLLDDNVIDVLEKYRIRTTFSFDGPKDIHDKIRKYNNGKGSYEDLSKGRKNLKENTKVHLSGAIMVLTKSSIKRVREIIDEFVDLGQTVIHLKPVTKLGKSKKNWDDNALGFDEYWKYYLEALEYMKHLQSQGVMIVEQSLLNGLKKLLHGVNTGGVDSRNPCGLVHGVLNYDLNGKIYACHEGKRTSEFKLGSVSDSVESVLLSSKAFNVSSSSVLDKHKECRACSYLPYCAPCPAQNYQQTGDKEIIPYQSWQCKFTLHLYDYIFKALDTEPEPLMKWWKFEIAREFICNSTDKDLFLVNQ